MPGNNILQQIKYAIKCNMFIVIYCSKLYLFIIYCFTMTVNNNIAIYCYTVVLPWKHFIVAIKHNIFNYYLLFETLFVYYLLFHSFSQQ